MVKLLEILKQVEPASIKVASLALKRTPKSIGYVPGNLLTYVIYALILCNFTCKCRLKNL